VGPLGGTEHRVDTGRPVGLRRRGIAACDHRPAGCREEQDHLRLRCAPRGRCQRSAATARRRPLPGCRRPQVRHRGGTGGRLPERPQGDVGMVPGRQRDGAGCAGGSAHHRECRTSPDPGHRVRLARGSRRSFGPGTRRGRHHGERSRRPLRGWVAAILVAAHLVHRQKPGRPALHLRLPRPHVGVVCDVGLDGGVPGGVR